MNDKEIDGREQDQEIRPSRSTPDLYKKIKAETPNMWFMEISSTNTARNGK